MEAEKLLAVVEEDGDGACLHGARLDASHQKMSTQETAVHKLRVSVVQAEKLMAKDRVGTSDPFVTVRLGSVTHTTKVVAKTLAPHWNETWIFDLCTPSGGGGRGADAALEEEEVMEVVV
eukprot:CAMPEP_0173098058 /NCGR_PEP_ID=MMETSP1102-20130122/34434_1 /TAXON_ID=49646 /ORGANISM="Geminigera sp., Strain Caron Lab Isolate" /LENGTH=119 /DNA_ID=CAMNT_0013990341 /DNA_START=373 /DNA_END=731 /DNA_ORIENTATION=-